MKVKLRLGIASFANFIRRPVQYYIDQQTKLSMFENCGLNSMINEEKFYYLYKYIESSKRCAKNQCTLKNIWIVRIFNRFDAWPNL